jgi:hypothetical protein
LVTPTKNTADYGQLSTSRDIKSGRATSPFWAERPAVWFAQAEAQFTLARISSEQTKFYYVTSQLEHRYASEVEDIITSPPKRNPYTTLKTELVKRLSPSKERIHQLLTLEMGDRKPSQYLRSLAPEDLLRSIWSSRLPPNIQAILAGQPEGEFNASAHCADRIIEAIPQPTIASITPLTGDNALLHRIEDLSRQVAALSAELAHLRSNYRDPPSCTRNRRSVKRPPSRDDAKSTLCWFHRRYGARAQKCIPPCSYCQQGQQKQRKSTAARLRYNHRLPLHHGHA